MKNEEKAMELCQQIIGVDIESEIYTAAMDMAEWKDKQLKEACSNCESNLIEMGKRCAWRSLSNDYCWEK